MVDTIERSLGIQVGVNFQPRDTVRLSEANQQNLIAQLEQGVPQQISEPQPPAAPNKVNGKDPNSIDALADRIAECLRKGDYEGAQAIYDKILDGPEGKDKGKEKLARVNAALKIKVDKLEQQIRDSPTISQAALADLNNAMLGLFGAIQLVTTGKISSQYMAALGTSVGKYFLGIGAGTKYIGNSDLTNAGLTNFLTAQENAAAKAAEAKEDVAALSDAGLQERIDRSKLAYEKVKGTAGSEKIATSLIALQEQRASRLGLASGETNELVRLKSLLTQATPGSAAYRLAQDNYLLALDKKTNGQSAPAPKAR
jgi:hypothetical protein